MIHVDRTEVAVSLGAVGLIPAIYGAACPPLATVRDSHDPRGHLALGVSTAAITSAVAVLALAVGLKSWNVAVFGGAMAAAYAAVYAVAWQAEP